MSTQGIRGATTIEQDTSENVIAATQELLEAILDANPELTPEDISSAIFTTTHDTVSAFPALAARQLGWDRVAMICTHEIPVPGSLPRCIRVLINWNTEKKQDAIQHVYLRTARNLRPDIRTKLSKEKVQ